MPSGRTTSVRALRVSPHPTRPLEADSARCAGTDAMDAMVASTRLELGGQCLEDGDYQSGIVAYNAALQRSPEVPPIAPPHPTLPHALPGLW